MFQEILNISIYLRKFIYLHVLEKQCFLITRGVAKQYFLITRGIAK